MYIFNSEENPQVKNCYNVGNVSATAKEIYMGGIIGINGESNTYKGGTISNCYCTTATTYSYYYWNGSKIVTSTTGKVEANTLKTYLNKLGDEFEEDEENINNGYPILKWQKNVK